MKKKKAISEADRFREDTGQNAYVVDCGGTFEWYCESFFDNGFETGTIVYGTDTGFVE